MYGGHYVAHVMVDDKWYLFNDSSVSECSSDDAHSRSAYALFYSLLE